jgi:hypothetical protein
MIEILVSFCLVDNPDKCQQVPLNFAAASITPQQCMVLGQAEMAKWMQAHPNWRPRKWTCGPAGRFAKA